MKCISRYFMGTVWIEQHFGPSKTQLVIFFGKIINTLIFPKGFGINIFLLFSAVFEPRGLSFGMAEFSSLNYHTF